MARVRVKLFAEYYELAGRKHLVELEVPDGTTVIELARMLEEKFPKLRGRLVQGDSINEETKVLVNGRLIDWLEGEKTRLRDGDAVAFFPPAAGG
jgi:molybdopterin synthase sulfur carrier subunit